VQGEREHPVALEAPAAKVGHDVPAHVGKLGRHLQYLVELLLVALLLPLLVVEILTAARHVRSDRLDVPVRVRTDPHLLPRWRDHQVADALNSCLVGDRFAVLILVAKSLPRCTRRIPGPRTAL
jgi:hypothetical protein